MTGPPGTRLLQQVLAASLAVVVVWLNVGGVAVGQLRSTASASQQLETGSLQPPTQPAAAPGTCSAGSSDAIVVSWTATTSSWADGYEVQRSTTTGGPYGVVASPSGRSTTSFTDTGLAFSTTYYYRVVARRFAWRSPQTAEVSLAARSPVCL